MSPVSVTLRSLVLATTQRNDQGKQRGALRTAYVRTLTPASGCVLADLRIRSRFLCCRKQGASTAQHCITRSIPSDISSMRTRRSSLMNAMENTQHNLGRRHSR